MRVDLEILDTCVAIHAPEEILAPIASAYRRFQTGESNDERWHVRCDPMAKTPLEIDGVARPWIDGVSPTLQLYRTFLAELMLRVSSHAILHGASLVAPDGTGLLIAAPSGHGKSSLTLQLMERGYRFLGDDYAALNLTTGDLAPYPRAVGMIVRGASPAPQRFREAAQASEKPRLMGKVLLDVGEVCGEQVMATEPAPLKHVFLLGGTIEPKERVIETQLDLGVRLRDLAQVQAELAEIAGVELLSCTELQHLALLSLVIDHTQRPTEALALLIDSERVLFSEKSWNTDKDFEADPVAAPCTRREAAELLGREWLNRSKNGALSKRIGPAPLLFMELAGALKTASCHRIQVGKFSKTVALLESLLDSRDEML